MKILAAETNLGSATNVSNAPVVRLFNSGTDNILVTRKDYNAVVVGSFIVPAGQVVYCEKYFTDTLEGSSDVKATKVAYSSMMSFASSGSSGPTYTYSVSASSVDEGGNWTTTVTTTNVDDNTTLYWSLSGTGITSADFSSGALTGSGTISNNTFNFSHTVAADTLTEGTETVDIKLFTDSGRNTQVGNTISVTLNDTSLTPSYTISAPSSISEGSTLNTTITTANVANGTELWWSLSGTNIDANDFSSGSLTGSGTISSNTFSFSHTLANDVATEGDETIYIKLYSDSSRSTQVGSTKAVGITDTSQAPVTGQTAYTSPGSYTFTVPSGVTSISMVAIGGGGNGGSNYGSGGGGGGLGYKNNYSVTAGQQLSVLVGYNEENSYVVNTSTLKGGSGGRGGTGTAANTGGSGGGYTGDGGGTGGAGGDNAGSAGAGGGGAAGYSGNGGRGGDYNAAGSAGAGGGAGGGGGTNGSYFHSGSGGGGTGLVGEGTSGGGGNVYYGGGNGSAGGGDGGSLADLGNSGQMANEPGRNGGQYGGGAGGGGRSSGNQALAGGTGKHGAVRIIWPGNARQFPSTRTADE